MDSRRITGFCFFFSLPLTLLLLGSPAIADDVGQIEAKLAKMLSVIRYSDGDWERREVANQALLKYLKGMCLERKLMDSSLKKSGLKIVTSDDNKLRFYSWDTYLGGTMPAIQKLVAFEDSSGKLRYRSLSEEAVNPLDDPLGLGQQGVFFEHLDMVKTKDGKTIYLVRACDQTSSTSAVYRLQALIIANGELSKFGCFQTPGKLLDSIDCPWRGCGSTDGGSVIQLSMDSQAVRIPLIRESGGNAEVTGRFLSYYFDGYHYVFGKKKPNAITPKATH